VAFVPQPHSDSSAHQHVLQQQQLQQRLVSGSADKTLRLWDAATRRTLKISRKLPSEVMCLAVTRYAGNQKPNTPRAPYALLSRSTREALDVHCLG
jgi:WD40 repeat protein